MKKPNRLYALSVSLLLVMALFSLLSSNRSIVKNVELPSAKEQMLHDTKAEKRVGQQEANEVPPEAEDHPAKAVGKPGNDKKVAEQSERNAAEQDALAVAASDKSKVLAEKTREKANAKVAPAEPDDTTRDTVSKQKDEAKTTTAGRKRQSPDIKRADDDFLQLARQQFGQKIQGAPEIPVGILSAKPASFFQKLQKNIDDMNPEERCLRYKGTYNPKRNRRIFYGALAASEPWELLEIVATETRDIFSGIVIVESNRTQNFTPRSFLRLEQEPTLRLLFGTDAVTIVPYVNEQASEQLLKAIASGISNRVKIDNHYLAREHMQRSEIVRAWREQGMTGDDVGLLVDMDETFTRDFLRAVQQCDDIEALHYERHRCDHRKVKLVAVTHTFESTPECITAHRRGFHPDMLIGACIEGIGNNSLHPLAPREEETFLRKPGFGGGDCDWSKVRSISKKGFYPLWDMSDFRRTCGGGMLGVDTDRFPRYAEYSAYHFHNFFSSFNATRHKMATYGHPKTYAMTRGLEHLSNDLNMMYRCVKNLQDTRKQKWKRVVGGFRAVKPFMPIYFQDSDYRRRRHAHVKKLVEMDDLYMQQLKNERAVK